MNTQKSTVDLDVVIPTKDRPDQLLVTLQALEQQAYRGFGVIVVDDGGKVEAETLVPDALRHTLAIRFVRNGTSIGAGPSRNRGVAVSGATFAVFLDDDCVASAELIGRHHATLASAGRPIVALGPILSPPGERLPVWAHWDADRLEREYKKLGKGTLRPGWMHLFTGNVGLRRSDFLAVGGFDERFPRGEDIELGYRLWKHGCDFAFDSKSIVWHHSQRTLRSWLRITAATAWFDVEWQRLVPESARLAVIDEKSRTQHWALRLVRKAFRGPLAQRCAIGGALGAGFALHALGADRLALPALSVARDLTYWRALQEATAADLMTKEAA